MQFCSILSVVSCISIVSLDLLVLCVDWPWNTCFCYTRTAQWSCWISRDWDHLRKVGYPRKLQECRYLNILQTVQRLKLQVLAQIHLVSSGEFSRCLWCVHCHCTSQLTKPRPGHVWTEVYSTSQFTSLSLVLIGKTGQTAEMLLSYRLQSNVHRH